jgi:hypothetical protein
MNKVNIKMKFCVGHQEYHLIEDFYKHKGSPDGVDFSCKEIRKTKEKESKNRNKNQNCLEKSSLIEKSCLKCLKIKSINEFYKNVGNRDGFQYHCKSCDKLEKQVRKNTNKGRFKFMCQKAKDRAKRKNLPFNLTIDFLEQLYNEQNKRCAISGILLNFETIGINGKIAADSPSIDKITPEIGYVKGNVRLVSYQVNCALLNYGDANLFSLIEHIILFNKELQENLIHKIMNESKILSIYSEHSMEKLWDQQE